MQFGCSNTKQPSNSEPLAKNVLTAYTEPPSVEFSIDEFESYALSRLNVLRWVEKQTGLGKPIRDKLNEAMRINNLHIPLNDQISHFIGRLCFCQTTERRRWFLNTEKILFETRYKTANTAQIKMVHNELCGGYASYNVLSKKMIISDEYLNGKTPIPFFQSKVELRSEKEMLPYYKVPFTEVINLVGRRSVYILDGFAYVPNNRFFSIITGKFRAHLNKGLINAQKALHKMKCDPITMATMSRIDHIIDGLYKITNGPQYKTNKGKKSQITAKNVNKLANIHYPLCMQSSIQHLQSDGHMKHGGRMHLGLFLKGIGLSLSESLVYWRLSFTKIGGDKFNKQYAYNVRHNYGKEGKRIDYSPYSCNKIISCTPNNGDFHGCPLKIFDPNNLRQYLLLHKKMNSNDVDTILNFVKGNHYQLGCRHVFSVQHKDIMKKKNIKIDDINSQWSHPNEYFDESWRLYHGDEDKKENEEKQEMDIDKENAFDGNNKNTNTNRFGANNNEIMKNNNNNNHNTNGMNVDE